MIHEDKRSRIEEKRQIEVSVAIALSGEVLGSYRVGSRETAQQLQRRIGDEKGLGKWSTVKLVADAKALAHDFVIATLASSVEGVEADTVALKVAALGAPDACVCTADYASSPELRRSLSCNGDHSTFRKGVER